jgi:hypothetical protein
MITLTINHIVKARWMALGTAISLLLTPTPIRARPGARSTRQVAERVIEGEFAANFLPSLQARENAEFLVCPALIAQQLLSGQPLPTGGP